MSIVYLTDSVLRRFAKLGRDPRHQPFFDQMGRRETKYPEDLFNELADILCEQYDQKYPHEIRFAIVLGYLAGLAYGPVDKDGVPLTPPKPPKWDPKV